MLFNDAPQAAAEARHTRNEERQEFLDAIVPRLDLRGTRLTETGVRRREYFKFETIVTDFNAEWGGT